MAAPRSSTFFERWNVRQSYESLAGYGAGDVYLKPYGVEESYDAVNAYIIRDPAEKALPYPSGESCE